MKRRSRTNFTFCRFSSFSCDDLVVLALFFIGFLACSSFLPRIPSALGSTINTLADQVNPQDLKPGEFTHFIQQEDGSPGPNRNYNKQTTEVGEQLYTGVAPSQSLMDSKTIKVTPTQPAGIVIKPSVLDFGERPLCVATIDVVEIINQSGEDLQVFSITTDSSHIHYSLFKQSILPPNANSSATVVFLPQRVGLIENMLTIKTNMGNIVYRVVGVGMHNPYRLHPFFGAKVAVNMPWTAAIEIYNPHPEPLSIKEIYTSGASLMLALPPAASLRTSWEVQPHQRLKVINVSFTSSTPGRFEGLVNFKTSREAFIIHVEVNVVDGGLHLIPSEIDFGTLTSASQKRVRHISILNAGSAPVKVLDIKTSSLEYQLSVATQKYIIPPATETKIASLTYSGRTSGQISGKVTIRTNSSDVVYTKLQAVYKARTLYGSLGYQPTETFFFIGQELQPVVQQMTLSNKFSVPLSLQLAEILDPNFQITNFSPGVVIAPSASWSGISIKFTPNSSEMVCATDLALTTNVSALKIPLHCYNGKLNISVSKRLGFEQMEEELNFGVVNSGEPQRRFLNFTNANPVSVTIYAFRSTISGLSISLDKVVGPLGETVNKSRSKKTNSPLPATSGIFAVLEPHHSALVKFDLIPAKEGKFDGTIQLETSYENRTLSVSYRSLEGGLTIAPSVLKFDSCFPGRMLKKTLVAQSTYSWPIQIVSVTSSDPRLVIPPLSVTLLQPNQPIEIGYAMFDTTLGSPADNFMEDLSQPGLSKPGEPLNAKDIQAVHRRDLKYLSLERAGKTNVKGVVTVTTDVLTSYTLSFRATISKPTIVKQRVQDYALTQSGSSASRMFPVHNPSDLPIYVQLLPFPEKANSLLPPPTTTAFFIPPEACKGVVLQPHSSTQLGPVLFSPQSLQHFNATLYIKNNLTILDYFTLVGEGGSGHFLFLDADKPITAMNFNITSDQLQRCNQPHTADMEIVINKTFKAINKGNLPIKIERFSVHRYGCEAFGFKITNCTGFLLNPDESVTITMSYRPDFLSPVLEKTLIVMTSRGELFYPLNVHLPKEMLSVCASSLSVHSFEDMIRRTFIGSLVIVFAILVFVVAREQKNNILSFLAAFTLSEVKRRILERMDRLRSLIGAAKSAATLRKIQLFVKGVKQDLPVQSPSEIENTKVESTKSHKVKNVSSPETSSTPTPTPVAEQIAASVSNGNSTAIPKPTPASPAQASSLPILTSLSSSTITPTAIITPSTTSKSTPTPSSVITSTISPSTVSIPTIKASASIETTNDAKTEESSGKRRRSKELAKPIDASAAVSVSSQPLPKNPKPKAKSIPNQEEKAKVEIKPEQKSEAKSETRSEPKATPHVEDEKRSSNQHANPSELKVEEKKAAKFNPSEDVKQKQSPAAAPTVASSSSFSSKQRFAAKHGANEKKQRVKPAKTMEAWKPVVKENAPLKEVIATVAPTKTANWSSILQGKDVNPPPQAFASASSPTTSHTEPASSTPQTPASSSSSSSHQVLASVIPLPTATPAIPAVAKKVEEILDEFKTQDHSFISVDEPERKPNASSKPTIARHIMMNPIFDDDFDRPASQEEEEDYPEWADEELPPVEFSFDNNYFGQPSIISPAGVIGQSKATQQQPPSPTSLYSPPFFSQSPENTTFFPSHSPPSSSGPSSRFGGPSLFSFLPSPPPSENSPSYLLQPHATYHNPLFGGGSNTDSPVSPAAANTSPPYMSSFSRTPGPSRPKQASPSAGQYQLF